MIDSFASPGRTSREFRHYVLTARRSSRISEERDQRAGISDIHVPIAVQIELRIRRATANRRQHLPREIGKIHTAIAVQIARGEGRIHHYHFGNHAQCGVLKDMAVKDPAARRASRRLIGASRNIHVWEDVITDHASIVKPDTKDKLLLIMDVKVVYEFVVHERKKSVAHIVQYLHWLK